MTPYCASAYLHISLKLCTLKNTSSVLSKINYHLKSSLPLAK